MLRASTGPMVRAARMGLVAAVGLVCGTSCEGGESMPSVDAGDDAGAPSRSLEATLALSEIGVSEPFSFEVPVDTRSVAIVVRGRDDDLYALASLQLGGEELVGIDVSTAPGEAMRSSYEDEQVGQMRGALFQSIRLGTFTHVYPHAPGQEAAAGSASLRVASTATGGTVSITILMSPEDGARRLPIHIIDVSEAFDLRRADAVADVAAGIFAQADIELMLDATATLDRPDLRVITDFSEPQEAPTSQAATLALAGQDVVDGDELNVFVVDELPLGVGGLSLGTPGPPVSESYYFGVVLRSSASDATLGRVLAHEVAHFAALQHVENRGISGQVYPDPIDDTAPGQDNLMESGVMLTPGQAFALARSPLLE